jgi:hypothetical protein
MGWIPYLSVYCQVCMGYYYNYVPSCQVAEDRRFLRLKAGGAYLLWEVLGHV